jgi:general secretion pathway protein L
MTGWSGLVLIGRGDDARWLRLADGALVNKGRGLVEAEEGEAVAAIVPAALVSLFPGDVAGLAPAQALAVAERQVAEDAASPVSALHLATGDGIAAIERAEMAAIMTDYAAAGLDPDPVVPAQLALPAPETGFIRATIGNETLVRGADGGFLDDPAITPLLVGDGRVADVPADTLPALIGAALADPSINLRQGPFARREPWTRALGDWRPLAMLAAAIALVTLLIPLILLVRLNLSSAALEDEARTIAARAVGGGAESAVSVLDARLRGIRGGGPGFLDGSAAIAGAVQQVPNTQMAALSFDETGVLRATLTATNPAELDALQRRIEGAGLVVRRGASSAASGRTQAVFEVSER